MSVAQPLRISYIELQSAEDIEFIELISRGCRCGIRQQGKNHYREEFPEPLTVLDRSLSFSVHRKTWYSAFIPVIKVLPIDVNDVLSNSAEQKFQTVYSKLNITIGLSAGDTSVVVPDQDNSTPPDTDGPHVTTEHLLSQRPRFRILVVGRSGVGKSTLINRAFGIEEASAQDFWPGKTDIERELISPQNDRFVLHDSQGFEAGMDYNGADVQAFVVRRKMQQHIKDQLHIVWLCLTTPIEDHGDRLLDPSAETLLEKHTSVLQNIPIIVVFTKYDKLLTTMAMRKEVDPGAAAKEYLQVHCIDPIAKFAAGTNLSYVTVSSKPGQAEGYKRLIALTYEKVIETLGPQQSMPPPSVVPSMVRRPPSLDLKIESTIAVGKRRYWMTLISDANIRECFDVIHSEVVLVWNFSDPFQYLSSGRFRELMKNLAGVDRSTLQSTLLPCSEVTNPSADSRVSLTASARIVQPFKAVLATVQSVHKAYQRSPNVHHMFMAYFVDLVHVLEILFALTINNSKQLTRGAISLAFDVYYQSEMRRNAHLRIKDFDYKIPARNAVFEKILSLVGSSPIEEEDIFKALQSTPPEDLERDKEWYVDDDKPEREKRLASLAGLVSDLDVQFRKEGGMDVLTDIIALQRTILDLMPRWHRERLASIVNLANFLNERFRMESGAEDLTQIIALRRAALERTPPGHQDRVLSVVNLANSLHERFKRESGMEDLMQAITLRYTALELTPVGRQSHRRSLVDLANSLHERYKREGGIENLTEIITLRRAAWKLTPPEHSDYPVSLVDLLDSLDERFSRDGGSEDLAEIINLRRAALQLTPLGHQGRFESLVNLSNRLHERFRKIDTLEDLNEIITLCRAALECAPPTALPPSNRCTFLLHLADCLCEKYRRLSVEAELTEAIKHACTTLVLCPSDHRDYVSCRDCLAKCVGLKTTKWRVPPPMSSVQQTVWYIAMETTKTFPLRLLNTRTGIVCNRDAQLSCFMDSAQYNELLTSMQDDLERKVRNAVLKFFRYTILSHRWGSGEPLLRDIERKNIYTLEDREGIAKLQNFCILALQHGYAWAWSDTCCIDKDSSLELQEAIASMFSWYRNSALTIVHLSDVPDIQSFTKSAWFSRGWTLQELLASPQVLFYMQDWSLYADSASWNHKVDNDVLTRLQEATGIGESHLTNFSPGVDDARSRLRWASTRSTTRPEDAAYSLFGIFGIHLPVLYGETVENALGRLLAEIISQSGDTSVLDWIGKESSFHSCLPADLTPYQTVPRIQSTPSDLTDHIDIDIEKARQMYSALTQLPSPRFFPGRRLVLPCIVHRITGVKLLETSSSTSHHTYKIVASGLVPLELTLSSRLQQGSGANLPYALIRPWNRKLLDPPAHGNDVLGGLLEWLRKPFNALLLKTLHNEYKRIPSDDPIGARVKDLASIDIDIECQTLEIV